MHNEGITVLGKGEEVRDTIWNEDINVKRFQSTSQMHSTALEQTEPPANMQIPRSKQLDRYAESDR